MWETEGRASERGSLSQLVRTSGQTLQSVATAIKGCVAIETGAVTVIIINYQRCMPASPPQTVVKQRQVGLRPDMQDGYLRNKNECVYSVVMET